MKNPSIRLAAVALSTAAGVFLAPVVASAQPPTNPVTATMRGHAGRTATPMKMPMKNGTTMDMSTMMTGAAKMRGHASMSGHHKSSADMPPIMLTGMAQKMRGHATMADAMRAHPELSKMRTSMIPVTSGSSAMVRKMRGHATMAGAMRAHPELGKRCKSMMRAMAAKMPGHATMAGAMRAHPELGNMS